MKTILIIEDEKNLAFLLGQVLKMSDYEVIWAQDALMGTKYAHEKKPDLIILDVMLPAGGGLAVLKNLALSFDTFSIPVVIYTGMEDDEFKEKILAYNIAAYLQKPSDMKVIVETVDKILKKQPAK